MAALQRILASTTAFCVVACLGIATQTASPSNLWCRMFPNAWFCTN